MKFGSGLGTDWGAGEGMEGLVSGRMELMAVVMTIEMLVLEWKWNCESGSESGSVGDGVDGTNGGDSSQDNGNGINDDDIGSNDDGDDSDDDVNNRSSSMIPTFSENVGVVLDMSGKEPVHYYRLFISGHIIDMLEETNWYGDQYVESHQDHLPNHPT